MLFQSHNGGSNGAYSGAHHAYDPNDGTYGAYNPNDAYDAAIYGGYGGFGAAKLAGPGKGMDFNCNSLICFGGGATNDNLFKSLQQKINQLAGPGTKPLTVDGFIGPATVTALRALGAAFLAFSTKEQVAADAPTIVATLDALIASRTVALQAGAAVPPLAPAGTPITFTPPTPQSVAVATQGVATLVASGQLPSLPGSSAAASLPLPKKSNTMLLVAGAVAAVLVVGGVGYYVYRRKAQREG
jgi:lysozyme family protein